MIESALRKSLFLRLSVILNALGIMGLFLALYFTENDLLDDEWNAVVHIFVMLSVVYWILIGVLRLIYLFLVRMFRHLFTN